MSTETPIIEAKGLTVRFKLGRKQYIHALDHVDITVNEGDIFGILGPNGAGKSTAMYCFLGLLQPDQGRIKVLGETPTPGHPIYNEIAYLPEEPHYHPYMQVSEAVHYYASLYRRRITEQEIQEALQKVGLAKFRKLRIAKCSKGMKQKVGLAACMLFEPRIIYLDEPTRGLDPIMVRIFRDHLLDIHSRGTTIVLNSHVLSEVELVCRRIAIMNEGKILSDGPLHDLVETRPDSYEVTVEKDAVLPPYADQITDCGDRCKAYISWDHLEQFVGYCRQENIRLLSCRMMTESLEDVFMRILGSEVS